MNSWFFTSKLGNFLPYPFGSDYSLLIHIIKYKKIFLSLVKYDFPKLKQ